MSTYRHALPQLSDRIFLTDGGIETTLIYHEGIELPHFAAFVLLDDDAGRAALRRYFEPYLSHRPGRRPGHRPGVARRGGPAATGATCWATRARRWPT